MLNQRSHRMTPGAETGIESLMRQTVVPIHTIVATMSAAKSERALAKWDEGLPLALEPSPRRRQGQAEEGAKAVAVGDLKT